MNLEKLNNIFGNGLMFKDNHGSCTLNIFGNKDIVVSTSFTDLSSITCNFVDNFPCSLYNLSDDSCINVIRMIYGKCIRDLSTSLHSGLSLITLEQCTDGCIYDSFCLQFSTIATIDKILNDVGMVGLRGSSYNLNDVVIPYSYIADTGRWWWDSMPINGDKIKSLGIGGSLNLFTNVGKTTARYLIKLERDERKKFRLNKETGLVSEELVHYKVDNETSTNGGIVRKVETHALCNNGSYHCVKTSVIKRVTCIKCLKLFAANGDADSCFILQ